MANISSPMKPVETTPTPDIAQHHNQRTPSQDYKITEPNLVNVNKEIPNFLANVQSAEE